MVTASPSGIGGFGANHNIRQAVVFLDVPMMQQPEMYLGKVHELFQEDGKTVIERTEKFLKTYIDAYANWVYKF